MLLVRALREDRTILCVNDFIRGMETLDVGGFKLPALGPKYVPVWKSTSELGRRGQTSEISSSVKSKSIRLIFGRIDCSRRVLEAQEKSLIITV